VTHGFLGHLKSLWIALNQRWHSPLRAIINSSLVILSLQTAARVALGIYAKIWRISERMSSGELAVNPAISRFRWPNKKKSLGARSGGPAG
jgi:hypothetical protein